MIDWLYEWQIEIGKAIGYIDIAAATMIAALGWLIAVLCIFRKHISGKGKYICFFSDLVVATFVTITFALVVELSFGIYTDLQEEKAANLSLRGEVANLISANEQLRSKLLHDTTIVEKMQSLWQEGARDDFLQVPLTEIGHLAEPLGITNLAFVFPLESAEQVLCTLDGYLLYCRKLQ